MNQILGFLTWFSYYEVLRGSRGVSFTWWSIWGAMVPHKVAFSHGQQHLVRSRYWLWIGVACVRIAERQWSIFCFIFLWLEMCDLLCLLYLEYLGFIPKMIVQMLACWRRRFHNQRGVRVEFGKLLLYVFCGLYGKKGIARTLIVLNIQFTWLLSLLQSLYDWLNALGSVLWFSIFL